MHCDSDKKKKKGKCKHYVFLRLNLHKLHIRRSGPEKASCREEGETTQASGKSRARFGEPYGQDAAADGVRSVGRETLSSLTMSLFSGLIRIR